MASGYQMNGAGLEGATSSRGDIHLAPSMHAHWGGVHYMWARWGSLKLGGMCPSLPGLHS